MKIGILQPGLVPDVILEEVGDYDTQFHALLDGREVTTVASAAEFERMDRSLGTIRLLPEAANMHIFDRDSGRNVSLRAQG